MNAFTGLIGIPKARLVASLAMTTLAIESAHAELPTAVEPTAGAGEGNWLELVDK